MKKLRKLSLKEELEKEAAEIEKELAEDPELDNLKVSKELDDAIYAEIQRYETGGTYAWHLYGRILRSVHAEWHSADTRSACLPDLHP